MVTTIGLTVVVMLLIMGILYAVPYLAGKKSLKSKKDRKDK
jgi:hypothetical protein